jgi:hypothetical protein
MRVEIAKMMERQPVASITNRMKTIGSGKDKEHGKHGPRKSRGENCDSGAKRTKKRD